MNKPKWQNRKILDESHAPDLEHAAAIYEFEHGLHREDAEHKAFKDYANKHHQAAAAHHLRGMRAAAASGDIEESRKHSIAYTMHMQALGHDPMDAVPGEIKALVEAEDKTPHYKFKAHKADSLFLP